jgi:hypothetical protein
MALLSTTAALLVVLVLAFVRAQKAMRKMSQKR